MAVTAFFSKHSHSGGWVGALLRFCIRTLQFVLAITVAGLYGIDLSHAREHHHPMNSKWLYAEVVAGLSALTCLIYAIPFFKSHWACAWDWIVFVLWTAVFGIFGKIYLPNNDIKQDDDVIRMKHAVWVDLCCMLLWCFSAAYSTLTFLRAKRSAAQGEKV